MYVSTHAETLLPKEFLEHFHEKPRKYNDTTAVLIAEFAEVYYTEYLYHVYLIQIILSLYLYNKLLAP